jgi:hypothetical protein
MDPVLAVENRICYAARSANHLGDSWLLQVLRIDDHDFGPLHLRGLLACKSSGWVPIFPTCSPQRFLDTLQPDAAVKFPFITRRSSDDPVGAGLNLPRMIGL